MKKILFLLLICVVSTLSVRADEPREIAYSDLAEQIATSPVPVVVDCYATWCGPCRVFGPVFDQVAASTGKKARFFRVDIDASPEILKLGVNAVPTVLVFYINKGELKVEAQEGALDKSEFQSFIDRVLKMSDGSRLKQINRE
ncbi:MAG: hypothetical protein HDR89_08010 [Bacteroides sp.]|nr:hypothetical protein [Bacteroides sp.]MBD5350807.1 hypothetical protein [Bacteroides sp.]